MYGALVALVEVGQRLDLVPDFGVGGEVAGAEAVLEAELLGGLSLGGEVFLFVAFVHQSCCEERDLGADSGIGHVLFSPRLFGARVCGGGLVVSMIARKVGVGKHGTATLARYNRLRDWHVYFSSGI